jgi:DNA replication protein DnaC
LVDPNGDTLSYEDLNKDFQETLKRLQDSVTMVERLSADAAQSQYLQKRPRLGERSSNVHEQASQASFPCYAGLPRKNPYFRCRIDELESIETFFAEHDASDGLHCCVIYGFGGVGKSALAHAFVERCMDREQYDAIFWVKSQTKAELTKSFTEMGRNLKLLTATTSAQSEYIQRAKDWLNKTGK